MSHEHEIGDRVVLDGSLSAGVLWAVDGETGHVVEVGRESVTVDFPQRLLRMDLPAEVVTPA